TVSRRIFAGFSAVLLLVILVSALGAWALRSVTDTYESALRQRRVSLVPTLVTKAETQGANMAYLRFLLEGTNDHLAVRDSLIRLSRNLLTQLSDSAASDDERARWTNVDAIFSRWLAAGDSAIRARAAGRTNDAIAIRRSVEHPIRLQLDSALQTLIDR